jgi:hypothetical protein
MELSIGTIVIIVIAVTMLVFGIVFVRGIMCSAIGLTSQVSSNAEKEINKLFGASQGEVQCLGGGDSAIDLIPGRTNYLWCGIRAPINQQYEIQIKDIIPSKSTKEQVQSWIVGEQGFSGMVEPGQEDAIKILRLAVPDNADEQTITVKIDVIRAGKTQTQTLDYDVKRVGMIRSAVC